MRPGVGSLRLAQPVSRPILYVCAPFATRTTQEQLKTNRVRLAAMGMGWAPLFAPAALSDLGLEEGNKADRAASLDVAVSLLLRSTACVVVGKRVTAGMEMELRAACGSRIPCLPAALLCPPGQEWVMAWRASLGPTEFVQFIREAIA